MKQLTILIAIGLGIILLIQNLTNAGPSPSPRSVPIIVQEVMQPSRMVAAQHTNQDSISLEQVPIILSEGQVFILTSWTVNPDATTKLFEGPEELSDKRRDVNQKGQHVFPTGIRFARDATGKADIYVKGVQDFAFFIQGYITDDF